MRLDKFLGACGICSRSESSRAAKAGRITLNGATVKRADLHVDEQKDEIFFDGVRVLYEPFFYVFLNKPTGYISATEDGALPVVTSLLPEKMQKAGIFPCGRLDRDTVGWMLLTNDGTLSHRLLSPKRHVEKVYRFTCEQPLAADAEERLSEGIVISGGERCKSARLLSDGDRMGGEITLTEGKYHEIKRMLEALSNKVTSLERIAFAGIPIDRTLSRGEWRRATKEELAVLFCAAELTEPIENENHNDDQKKGTL